MLRPAAIALLALLSIPSSAWAQTCAGSPVAVQILGSGGPDINPDRAPAGYLPWVGAQANLLLDVGGMTVTAFRIPHASLPTLAYRVQTRDVSVVFSSDQNGSDPKFINFAKGANVLIMHLAIAANAPPSPLHASPAVVGRVAQEAGVKRLILSHIGQFDLEAAIADVKKAYTGALTVGSDLQCTPVQ